MTLALHCPAAVALLSVVGLTPNIASTNVAILNIAISAEVETPANAAPSADRTIKQSDGSQPDAKSTDLKIDDALFAKYAGAEKIPDDLKRAYTAFAAAAKTGFVNDHLLPHSQTITYEERKQDGRLHGEDVNVPFLKTRFVPEVWVVAKDDDCYLLRAPTTGTRWVQLAGGKWKIYQYFDKPIR